MILRNISGGTLQFGGFQPDLQEPEQHELFVIMPGGTIVVPDEVRTHPIVRKAIAEGKLIVDSYDPSFDSFVTQEEVSDLFDDAAAPRSFTFRPGELAPLAKGVYNDWNALYADYSATDGDAEILIDDSITSPAVIPAGAYTFRIGTVMGTYALLTTPVELELSDGVTFTNLRRYRGIMNVVSVSTAPIYTITTPLPGFLVFLENGTALRADGSAPMFQVNSPGVVGFITDKGGKLVTGVSPVVDVAGTVGPGPFAAFSAFVGNQGEINTDVVTGDALAFGFVTVLESNVILSKTQTGFTNPITYTMTERVQWSVTSTIFGGGSGLPGEFVRCDPTGGGFAVTLPLAADTLPGETIIVKNITASVNPITVTASGADLIDGAATDVMSSAFESKTYVCDGISNWYVV